MNTNEAKSVVEVVNFFLAKFSFNSSWGLTLDIFVCLLLALNRIERFFLTPIGSLFTYSELEEGNKDSKLAGEINDSCYGVLSQRSRGKINMPVIKCNQA